MEKILKQYVDKFNRDDNECISGKNVIYVFSPAKHCFAGEIAKQFPDTSLQ